MAKLTERKQCESRHALRSLIGNTGDLEMHLSDALTVVSTAQQRYAGEEAEFLGILDLIDFKLVQVRETYEAILNLIENEFKHRQELRS